MIKRKKVHYHFYYKMITRSHILITHSITFCYKINVYKIEIHTILIFFNSFSFKFLKTRTKLNTNSIVRRRESKFLSKDVNITWGMKLWMLTFLMSNWMKICYLIIQQILVYCYKWCMTRNLMLYFLLHVYLQERSSTRTTWSRS